MQFYFTLQIRRLSRWLTAIGLHPILGMVIGIILFVGLSMLLFYKTEFAVWIYIFVSTLLLYHLANAKRIFLPKIIFDKKEFISLRLIENSLLAAPFIGYLLYEKQYLPILILGCVTPVLSFFTNKPYWNKTIPTPFKRLPFEFTLGFRKTFWLIFFAYILIYQSLRVDNYYLGLFGLGQLFLTSMSYFPKPEPHHFVWIYTYRAVDFLKKKFLISALCMFMISVFALLGMIIGFPQNWLITIAVYALGFIFIGSVIVAKYSAYPQEMNIAQAILYALSILFPPLMLITIWIFYSKSKKRLKPILEC